MHVLWNQSVVMLHKWLDRDVNKERFCRVAPIIYSVVFCYIQFKRSHISKGSNNVEQLVWYCHLDEQTLSNAFFMDFKRLFKMLTISSMMLTLEFKLLRPDFT